MCFRLENASVLPLLQFEIKADYTFRLLPTFVYTMLPATHPKIVLEDILEQAKMNAHLTLEEYTLLHGLLKKAIELIKNIDFDSTVNYDDSEPMDWE